MDMYGLPTPDFFRIDDLLDFSNDDIFSSDLHHHHHNLAPPEIPASNGPSTTTVTRGVSSPNSNGSKNFTDDLCFVPSDDVVELEWLSKFVDDSFTDYSVNNLTETTNFGPETSVPSRARSKRSRAVSTHKSWTSLPQYDNLVTSKKRDNSTALQSPSSSGVGRKCMHCGSERTPQWRTGPLGPKTLCNACGVRHKSGRLVPEYRPAASPTFVLTQHSNSHRKVMELRKQKEILRQEESGSHQQLLYKVC
ncbi:hypothetical protein NE237_029760 [Protea cynaroides]|uniref:GATA transcription factor n=1 Tax=Protea cynaroides TaxID=273540 RepID=A0A9Q0GUH7_9MAGN|nr:hypothetical protein NE237_029760 [Protea cynaroides]